MLIPTPRPPESGNRYTVLQIKDNSHGTAKRYVADLLINEALNKHEIRQIIRAETEIVKAKEIYRDKQTEKLWHGTPAHIVWLHLFTSREDAADYNAFCRSEWISDSLSPKFVPMRLKGNDKIDDITIEWPSDYELRRALYDQYRISQADYLHQAAKILASLTPLVNRAISLTEQLDAGQLTYDKYITEMQQLEPQITALDQEAGNIGQPPLELNLFTENFRSLTGYAFNITFPLTEKGLVTWERPNRQMIVKQAIKYYLRVQKRVEEQLRKLYGKG